VFVSACVLIYASVKESTIRLTGNLLSTTVGVVGLVGLVGVVGLVGLVPPLLPCFEQPTKTKATNKIQIRTFLNIGYMRNFKNPLGGGAAQGGYD
jgi:hypothetical protein